MAVIVVVPVRWWLQKKSSKQRFEFSRAAVSKQAGDNPSTQFFTTQECAPVFYRIFHLLWARGQKFALMNCTVSRNKCLLWSFSTFLSSISSLRKPFLIVVSIVAMQYCSVKLLMHVMSLNRTIFSSPISVQIWYIYRY